MMTLIPKIDNPPTANYFRPINSCYTIYKIIAKFLANRLTWYSRKLFIPSIVFFFISGRLMQDNTILAYEVFRSFKNKLGK